MILDILDYWIHQYWSNHDYNTHNLFIIILILNNNIQYYITSYIFNGYIEIKYHQFLNITR